MSLLFDVSQAEDAPHKKSSRKRAEAPAAAEEPLIGLRRPVAPIPILGVVEDTYECIDDRCSCRYLEITDEHFGRWRVECFACGTGQWVDAVPGVLPEPTEADEFVFRGGRYDGQTIAQASRDSRGMDYIRWAAKEHPRQAVKTACLTWLDSLKTSV